MKMEFNEEFAVIQGSLMSLENAIGDLKNIKGSKDDESKMNAVVDAIQKIISGRGITPENGLDAKQTQILRRIHLFLVLNTNLDIQEKLIDDVGCGHIVDCAPNISKDVLIELVDRLSLHNFLYETIIYVPFSLGVELIDALLRKIDSLDPFHALAIIKGLSIAVYTKYIQLHGFQCDNNNSTQSKLFTYFKTSLQCFIKLNLKKLSSTATDELYRLAGFAMKSILTLIISCMKLYLNLPDQRLESNEIYDITLPDYYEESEKQRVTKEMFITELLLLCKANCCSITVDVWLFWAECDVEIEKDESKSLQAIIAEQMYVVCELLKEAKKNSETEMEISNEIVSMLSSMAVKPRDEDDQIRDADLDLIISNVSSSGPKSQKKWFKALMEKKEIFIEEKCIDCLESNLQLTDYKDVKIILEQVVTVLNSECSKEKADRLKNIALEAVRHLSSDYQLNLVQWYFEKFGLSVILMKDNFQAVITELFNKAVKTPEDKGKFLSEIVCVCLQSPVDLMMKVLHEGLANDKQISLMVNILKSLSSVCCIYYSENENPPSLTLITYLVDKIMRENLSDGEKSNFGTFTTALTNNEIVNNLIFTKKCLLPALCRSLSIRDWSDVSMWLGTLKALTPGFVAGCHSTLYCPLLVILAQIIEDCRWNLLTFSVPVASVCEKALILAAKIILPKFLESKTEDDKEVKWLQHKLSELLTPLNKSHFCSLWAEFGIDWAPKPYSMETFICDMMQNYNFIEQNKIKVTNLLEATENVENTILFTVSKILPVCTKMEWKLLAVRLKQLEGIPTKESDFFVPHTRLLANSLLLLLYATKKDDLIKNDSVLSCLDYCMRNFGHIMKFQEEIVNDMKSVSSEEKLKHLIKIMHIIGKLPPGIKDSCSIVMVNVLVEMMDNLFVDEKVLSTKKDVYVQDILINIGVLGNCEAVQVLAKKLLECMAHYEQV